jgi:tetratricopeptide (TPR) repeat protein
VSAPPDGPNARPRLLLALPLLLALAAHLPALWSGLVWDDRIIVRDQLVRLAGVGDVFLPPAGIPNWADNYYRPVVVLSYLVDFRWLSSPDGALVAHLSNLAFHLAATGFVWLLARRCFPRGGAAAALAAAGVFAVHPIHVESVNWISGRTDLLATLFLLAAVLLALRWRDERSIAALAGAAACLCLALLAKEVALAALAVVPAAWLLVPARDGAGAPPPGRVVWGAGLAALAIAVAAYLGARHAAGVVYGAPLEFGPVVVAAGLARSLAWYLWKLLLPWPLHNLVAWPMLPRLVVAIAMLLAAAWLAVLCWRRWRVMADGRALFALVWVLATIAPSLWIALSFGTRAPVADRYLYLPSVGAALAAGCLVAQAAGARRALAGWSVAALVAVFGALAFVRGLDWVSEVRLWTDATAKNPREVYGWHSLARAWRDAGDDAQALATYERALAAGDEPRERARVLYGMAEIRLARGELPRAAVLMERAARESPGFLRAGYGLGLVELLQAGDDPAPGAAAGRAAAARRFRAAFGALPDFHEARLALAQVMLAEGTAREAAGQMGEAIACYRSVLGQLDALGSALPAAQLAAYLRDAEPGIERDVPALRARAQGALARLRDAAASDGERCALP